MAGTQNSNNQRKIKKVLPLLLQLEKNKNDYLPEAVSFGPYHHGETKLAFVEAFKPTAVDLFTSGDGRLYHNKVLEIIDQVRNCYEQDSVADYSDDYLAQMMLHDASLIVINMEIFAGGLAPDATTAHKARSMLKHLGMLTTRIVWRDLILLNNQIPLRVIKLLINLRYGEGEHEKLLDRFLHNSIFRRKKLASSPQERMRWEPLHLLEAFHMLVVKDVAPTRRNNCTGLCCSGVEDPENNGAVNNGTSHGLIRRIFIHSFRTVKDLKAKGIYFKPSPTQSLKAVSFRSHFFYARLELPEWYVTPNTKAFFKNLVAYELSPDSPTQWEVASYINLMKSLIEGPEDMKELRERRILFNNLGSDEEVLNVYKDINTHSVNNIEVFLPVKDRIEAHFNSTIRRWMAELFHKYFQSPWTATAFLAAAALLAIAAAQLYYAVHPN